MNMKLIQLSNAGLPWWQGWRPSALSCRRPWRGSLAVVDEGLEAVRYIGSHAALVVGIVAFVAPLRPLRVARWLRRGWVVWRMAIVLKRILPDV